MLWVRVWVGRGCGCGCVMVCGCVGGGGSGRCPFVSLVHLSLQLLVLKLCPGRLFTTTKHGAIQRQTIRAKVRKTAATTTTAAAATTTTTSTTTTRSSTNENSGNTSNHAIGKASRASKKANGSGKNRDSSNNDSHNKVD